MEHLEAKSGRDTEVDEDDLVAQSHFQSGNLRVENHAIRLIKMSATP